MDETHTPYSLVVAARVRGVVAERGLQKRDIARYLNVSDDTAYRKLSGRVPFTLDEVGVIADALGVPPSDLIPTTTAA